MDGLGDRSRSIAMVMEWQAEEDPAGDVLAVSGPSRRGPRRRADEASLDELATLVTARMAVAVAPGAIPDPPEEMIGEPSF